LDSKGIDRQAGSSLLVSSHIRFRRIHRVHRRRRGGDRFGCAGAVLTKWEKTIKGSMCGSLNPQYDIVKLLRLYDAGKLKLDELVTRHYRLEDINQGYADLRAGEIIRGVILHES
jgi:hypothetical protein